MSSVYVCYGRSHVVPINNTWAWSNKSNHDDQTPNCVRCANWPFSHGTRNNCLPSQLLSFIYVSTAAAIGRKLWLRFVGNFSWRGTKKGHAIVKIVIVVHTVCYGSVHRRYQLPAINKRWCDRCAIQYSVFDNFFLFNESNSNSPAILVLEIILNIYRKSRLY